MPSLFPPASVHLWTFSQDQPAERLAVFSGWLDEAEQARAGGYRFERERVRFIARHGLARSILGSYLGVAPGEVRFRVNPHGKPSLAGLASLSFNLARSGEVAVLAVGGGRRLGVDVEVERLGLEVEELVGRIFTEGEAAQWQGLPAGERLEAFRRAWTRKEAVLKALGVGLALEPQRVAVSLGEAETGWLESIEGDQAAAQGWSVRQWQPKPGATAAVVAEGQVNTFEYYEA